MDFLLIAAFFIITMIVKAANKKKEAAKKTEQQARRRTQPASGTAEGAGAAPGEISQEDIFPIPEGECAPEHRHSAETGERHVLKPSYETGHAHTEASMSGFDDNCPTEEGKGSIPQGEDSMNPVAQPVTAPAPAAAAVPVVTAVKPDAHEAHTAPVPAEKSESSTPLAGLNTDKMREAMVLSEILAKPKALRRRERI